jgi:hypothetical protein
VSLPFSIDSRRTSGRISRLIGAYERRSIRSLVLAMASQFYRTVFSWRLTVLAVRLFGLSFRPSQNHPTTSPATLSSLKYNTIFRCRELVESSGHEAAELAERN